MRVAIVLAAVLTAAALAHAKEGDACYHRRLKKSGVCRQLSDCPATEQRQQCAFRRGDSAPTVCCAGRGAAAAATTAASPDKSAEDSSDAKPPTSQLGQGCNRVLAETDKNDMNVQRANSARNRAPGDVARAMCKQYSRHSCTRKHVSYPFDEITVVDHCESHNRTDTLIVGGREARSKEYPHMAMLGYGNKDDVQFLCGGTVISPRYVLTAAHCVFSEQRPVRWVVVGARERKQEKHKGASPQLIAVSERIKHPNYKPPLKYDDIALLRLASDISFEEGFVRPACLGTDARAEQLHKTATATGWGLTEWDGEQSSVLMTVTMNMTSLASCQKSYGTNSQGIPKGILPSHICAGSPGKDSCEGDSGGPLSLFPTDPYCMFHVVGVVSFGQFCGFNTPGVYSRVSAYLPWIENIVWPVAGATKPPPLPPVYSQ